MKRYLFFISQPYSLAILRPIQKVIRERGDQAAWYFDGPGEKYLRQDEIKLNTFDEVKQYNARAVFVPGNRIFDFFPGIKVQIFHGFNVNKRNDNQGHFRIRGFFDLYCTQGPATTKPFEKLAYRYKYFKVKETGWSKMDPLFSHQQKTNKRPEILFTSTFTPKLSCAKNLFETIRNLADKDNWHWTVTFHPRMDPEIISLYKSMSNENLLFIETDDIIPLYLKADVMVSDTSSVISEFLLLNKPVVTFRNRRPGPHLINVTSPDEVESAIEFALTKPEKLLATIQNYAKKIHPYRDGLSSERVLNATEYFLEHDFKNMPTKPLNLFRRLKMRKRVGYYHWK